MDAIRQYKKLLCITNDPETSKVIIELLTNSFGKEVVEVIETNAWEEGFELFQKLKPEIIFCDENMPDKSGYEVCQDMRYARS